MSTTNSHVRPRKEETKNLSLYMLLLVIFVGFIAGGLIVSFDFLAPAPNVQP